MRRFQDGLSLVLMAMALLAAGQSAGGQDDALTMKDIAAQRRQKVSCQRIVEKATARGVAFEATAVVQNQLRRMGFKPDQIDALKDSYSPPAKADDAAPLVPGQGLRSTAAQRERILAQIKQINRASGADLQAVQSRHVTLWAAKDDQAVFLPDIKKLDRFLESKCQEPLRSGLDKRAAHVILITRRYEYEKWLRAMFDVMGDPFRRQDNPGGNDELKAALLKGVGYVPPNFAVFCTEGQQADWVHRLVATGMGYMVFTQATESQDFAPLACGFANGMESVLAGAPNVMLFSNSYHNVNRDLGADPQAWLHLVQQRIATKEVTAVDQLLRMDTNNMLLPQYAEAWTLTGLLAKQPAKFAALVLALREDKATLKVIQRVYGWDEKELTAQWHQSVLRQR